MIIKTLNNDYHVIQTISTSENINIYVAKINNNTQLFILNEICNRDLINMYINDLLKLKEEKETNFVDLATIDSKLYVIFKYKKPNLIEEHLTRRKFSFEEKVRLITNYLFEFCTITNLPLLVQKSLTDPENINVKSDNTVYFNYSLKPVLLIDKKDIFYGISALIKLIFARDLKSKKGEKLHLIIEKCNKSLYNSVHEIHQEMETIIASSLFLKFKKFFKKEETKRKLKLVKNISLGVFTLAAITFVYFQYLGPATEQTLNPKTPVTKIGDISVYDDKLLSNNDPNQKPTVIKVNVN